MFAAAEAYHRFMGRYSKHLAPQFADFVRVEEGQRVLDVGCGTGMLTTERHPDVDVRCSAAEQLPWAR